MNFCDISASCNFHCYLIFFCFKLGTLWYEIFRSFSASSQLRVGRVLRSVCLVSAGTTQGGLPYTHFIKLYTLHSLLPCFSITGWTTLNVLYLAIYFALSPILLYYINLNIHSFFRLKNLGWSIILNSLFVGNYLKPL